MIANIVPLLGTHVYLESNDLEMLLDTSFLEGKLLGSDEKIYSKFTLEVKNLSKDADPVRYFCNANLESTLLLDEELCDVILNALDKKGRISIPYRNNFRIYSLVIADVLKLKEHNHFGALKTYNAISEYVASEKLTTVLKK